MRVQRAATLLRSASALDRFLYLGYVRVDTEVVIEREFLVGVDVAPCKEGNVISRGTRIVDDHLEQEQ